MKNILTQLQVLLLSGTVVPIFGQIVHNVVVSKEKPYELNTPNYPNDMGWKDNSVEWNLQVESDSKVKIVCTDIGMVQRGSWTNDCPNVYLSVDGGQGERKFCDNYISDFIYLSDGPLLKIKVKVSTKGTAMVSCIALNTGDPTPEEIVKLDPHRRARLFQIYGNHLTPFPYLNRLWVFESPPGTRMSFQCDLSVDNKKPTCGWNSLRFYNGIAEEEFCENKHFVWFSKGNKAKLRFQLDNYGHGRMSCIVQSITGPNPNEYENAITVEVDSSEHGVAEGAKQTSCKCGWSNKRGARIINGKEAGMYEFPWMVHLHANHETSSGNWGESCGGSILTERHILTAAHCVVHDNVVAKPENIKMELAKHDSKKPTGREITIEAEKILIKDTYLTDKAHDIAVILTKQTIDFSTPIVGPVCIDREELPIINRQITLMGWGRTEDSASSNYLQKGKSRVIDQLLCGGDLWDLCTTSSPSSFCSGDSGGPLVWLDPDTNRYSQVSLVSRGNSCKGEFMFSTLVSYFYDWIQEVIKDTDPSVNTCHKI